MSDKAKILSESETREDHALAMLADRGCELFLVRGGPLRAYIWIGDKAGQLNDTISGEKPLRALAEAILAELDRPQKRRKARAATQPNPHQETPCPNPT